ncbi:type II toxin-antitoxin system YafQ family toxin [Acerihabitans arboris]|uniref:Type II toxin-antitoxin system mRNA interferase toxin, RelE/StbE family n=1 Tax=Acerihabitans arboris TaxID=2691583 RepID=A0A845SMW9_9GAMM|nr:type II toxin-antitoxin system YafQ family toxin [Acerihabitans arboris]NDL64296.1 type II toxin-antitoxin system mRNA interferase toxin, RelE/StbE family [Acerihabitans arboris]
MTNPKRKRIPRRIDYTRTFQKSWERYNRAGRRDMNAMADVMALLFRNDTLAPEYLDHELSGGEWGGARELHVGGDFLLIYRINETTNLLTFIDLGTHAELFE